MMIKNLSNGIFFCNKLQGNEDLGLQSDGDVSSAFGDNIANNDFDSTGQVGKQFSERLVLRRHTDMIFARSGGIWY